MICSCPGGGLTNDEDDKAEAERMESDASDDEEEMEIDGKAASSDVPMETETADGEKPGTSGGAAASKAKVQVTPASAAVFSGLPQSSEGLESLIKGIHQTVNDSVLPRLHKCLTAKVWRTRT